MFYARGRYYAHGWHWQWCNWSSKDGERATLKIVALRIVSERARRGR